MTTPENSEANFDNLEPISSSTLADVATLVDSLSRNGNPLCYIDDNNTPIERTRIQTYQWFNPTDLSIYGITVWLHSRADDDSIRSLAVRIVAGDYNGDDGGGDSPDELFFDDELMMVIKADIIGGTDHLCATDDYGEQALYSQREGAAIVNILAEADLVGCVRPEDFDVSEGQIERQ